jgi:hypothetical protein
VLFVLSKWQFNKGLVGLTNSRSFSQKLTLLLSLRADSGPQGKLALLQALSTSTNCN